MIVVRGENWMNVRPLPEERESEMPAVSSSAARMVNPVADNSAGRGNDFTFALGERVGVRASVEHSPLLGRAAVRQG